MRSSPRANPFLPFLPLELYRFSPLLPNSVDPADERDLAVVDSARFCPVCRPREYRETPRPDREEF